MSGMEVLGNKDIYVPQPFEDRTWTGARPATHHVLVPDHVYYSLRRVKNKTGFSINTHVYAALVMFNASPRPSIKRGHRNGLVVDLSSPAARLLARICDATGMGPQDVLTAAVEDYMYVNRDKTGDEHCSFVSYMKAFTR